MQQLGELHDMYAEVESRDFEVVAMANEEQSLLAHMKVLGEFDSLPPFPLAVDINRQRTEAYERTTAYLIDKQGVIQQIFPMEVYDRAPWWPLFNEIDRLGSKSAADGAEGTR